MKGSSISGYGSFYRGMIEGNRYVADIFTRNPALLFSPKQKWNTEYSENVYVWLG